MDHTERMDELDLQIDQLDQSLGQATTMAAAFNTELERVKTTFSGAGQDVKALDTGISRGLRSAIKGAVLDGDSLSDSLHTLANSMVNSAFNSAVRPVADHVGGLVSQGIGNLMGGLFPFANGASFSQGRVQPFASGGVVDGPVTFPMRGGTGLMGEAGPEAIMPLSRGADGKLGVRGAGGGGNVSVVMNIKTPDVQGFRRSQAQIADQMGRVIGRGGRNR
ncbi:phage tail tape measure protein [uncultured Roseovarius sp.]|uniref:phage tail tape measure protein n=1 Tax=uncultured Roseovarius sp. TaxID=293344 RepID=UPI002636AD25|nr:phage tail tape measure protein [uncultured Roseovarius sp.]